MAGVLTPQIDIHTQPTMKPTLTLLALLAAGVMPLQGQGKGGTPNPDPNPAPSAAESAWRQLVAGNKQPEETKNKAYADAAASPEAQAVKASILAGNEITKEEYIILARIRNATKDEKDFETSVRALAASNKTGKGVSMAKAQAKFWDGDETGWTDDMILYRSELSSKLASVSLSSEFRNQVWNVLKDRNVVGTGRLAKAFFKDHRSSLPRAEQIEATRMQKAAILATPDRSPALNAWLVELSADLIALELDQP